MKWLDRLERRLEFLTIPQFPLFLATANGVCYFMAQAQPAFVDRLYLSPAAVFAGEWWRVLTFVFVPPEMNLFFMLLWLMWIYQCAQGLENAWGEFRFFAFYLCGAVLTVLASLFMVQQPLSNAWLNTTLLLAFATLFPDFEILFFFIIPMKLKVVAYITWGLTALAFFRGNAATQVGILAALVNYVIFFWPNIWRGLSLRWQTYQNRKRFRTKD